MMYAAAWMLLGCVLSSAAAAAAGLNVSGTLMPPQCSVDNGQGGNITVDFGDSINISRLNGSNYAVPVPYTVRCGDDGQPRQLRMRIEGTPSGWSSSVLQTSITALGIRIRVNGTEQALNTSYDVMLGNLPALNAVPVSRPGEEPSEGTFTASARLVAEYY